ncbi:MAG: argininosuccinate lyase [Gammaproteobacteria bacterium]|nr:argininosuccinate lyase [Gammaproteobacteria bacterium]
MADKKQQNQLWGGRFAEATDAFVQRFTASVEFDKRLYPQDIEGSLAHARMLHRIGVLEENELDSIVNGLAVIREQIERGEFDWTIAHEDVHMNIEARLTERIGDAGKKLHTGRSRNDQVATDMRLYLRAAIDSISAQLKLLLGTLIDQAEAHHAVIMPGFTHLQTAQPVTFGHHLLAWFEMLLRDAQRLRDCRQRVNVMPLGAAALAGTGYPIDREYTAAQLGFAAVAENSLDAVSDRDFAIEFCAAGALLMTHMSRIAEEVVLWMSAQFHFVELPDRFCTGSSIMPQKKNPDVAELVRGKSGRVNGNLIALLTIMKGQPLAYNKDNQEDKEPLFDTVDTLLDSLRAFTDMLAALRPVSDNMRRAAGAGFATATDLADYLVSKGLAFRDAHHAVGEIVAAAANKGCDIGDIPLAILKNHSSVIDDDVYEVLTLEGSVSSRKHIGGTAPAQVKAAALRARERIATLET